MLLDHLYLRPLRADPYGRPEFTGVPFTQPLRSCDGRVEPGASLFPPQGTVATSLSRCHAAPHPSHHNPACVHPWRAVDPGEEAALGLSRYFDGESIFTIQMAW